MITHANAYQIFVVNNTNDNIYFQVFSVKNDDVKGVFLGRLKEYQISNGHNHKEIPDKLKIVVKREYYSGPPVWEVEVEVSEQNLERLYITEKGFVKYYGKDD
jgi:hypothetical protein